MQFICSHNIKVEILKFAICTPVLDWLWPQGSFHSMAISRNPFLKLGIRFLPQTFVLLLSFSGVGGHCSNHFALHFLPVWLYKAYQHVVFFICDLLFEQWPTAAHATLHASNDTHTVTFTGFTCPTLNYSKKYLHRTVTSHVIYIYIYIYIYTSMPQKLLFSGTNYRV